MDALDANPVLGLPPLCANMQDPGQAEVAKKSVPRIFEILPKAMEAINDDMMEHMRHADARKNKFITALRALIELSVKLQSEAGAAAVNVDHINQTMNQVVRIFKMTTGYCNRTFVQDFRYDTRASTDAMNLAGTILALFQWEDQATVCKQELTKASGVWTVIDGLGITDCGLQLDAKSMNARVLVAYVDKCPENVDNIVANAGHTALLKWITGAKHTQDGREQVAPKEMQKDCCTVLDAVVKSSKNAKQEDKDSIQSALAAQA